MGILLALCFVTTSRAQDLTDLPLEDLLRVEVTTASKYRQDAREAPSQVQLITATDIEHHGWRTLGEALSSLPGFYVSDDRAYEYLGARGFLIPGDYSTRFLLLLDGQRLNDNLFEQASFGFNFPVDLSLVERIEVIPGPGSAIYGSNAVFGVINVITRKPSGRNAQRVSTTLTSDGWRELRGSMERRLGSDGPTLSASVAAGSKDGRDLRIPGAETAAPASDGVARGMDSAGIGRAFLSLRYPGLTLSAWGAQRDVRPPTALYGSLFNDRRLQLRDQSAGVSVVVERDLAPDLQFTGRAALQEQRFRGTYPYDNQAGASFLSRDDLHGTWWSAESRFLYTGFERHKLVYGVELQQDLNASMRNFDLRNGGAPTFTADQHSWRGGVYVQDEWSLNRDWRLSAGVRHDHHSIGFSTTSPRLALLWAAGARTTVKLLAATAFRLSSDYERLYAADTYLPNHALRPEQVRTTELIVERVIGGGQQLALSLYGYGVRKLIEQVEVNGGELQFQNAAGRIRSTGVELSWKAPRLGDGSAAASLAWNQTRTADGERLPDSPRWIAKLRGAHPLPGTRWLTAAEADAIGPRAIAGDGQSLGTQWWISASLSAKALLPGVDVRLRVVNLLDRDVQVPVGEAVTPVVPFYGRTLQLTLSHDF